ncbi:nSTAND1 domain-containing NTPase [Streptomyces sp. NBC_01451]|uniref:nSTAND1 domain-containing NTPase n=1 Tax=Streptomyces sp. NBC_01451 TaxID=2903872 RepID=UPI003FCD77A3
MDPEAGPVQRLAHELRELRRAAGNPSYRTMAEKAGFSATTLSDAARGQRLPSLAVVQGYVRACGGDPCEWELRWKDADAEAAGTVRDTAADAAPPYRGLARFEPDDRALFFGRDRLVEELRELVCGHRFAVLFGASGSGKSSLLRAGLIPRLREEIAARGCPAVLRVLTPGDRPATRYGELLAPAAGEPESWVVVDQFEEVFTLCRDKAERERFIELLLAARDPDSRLNVLIAVRADFYTRCAEHRELADALRGAGLLVGPMTADELREAVVGPAQTVGLLVERELTARIVDEVLDRPGALPMLSHALLETWKRRRSRLLTLSAYEAAGGVGGAIAATAEEVHGQLSPAQAHTVRRLLLGLIEPGQGTADTRRPLTRAELADWADPEIPVVVERLARNRLLTVDEEGVQLAHEALITTWPRLCGWIETDRERMRHRRRLAEAARAWLEHDRDPGTLYRGARLARAEELFAADGNCGSNGGGVELTASEREFLVASLDAREAERRAVSRTARRARVLVSAFSAVLVVSLVAGLAAWQQHGENERRRTDTAARRVAEVADAMRSTDPNTAMLLGVAAWRISPLPEARRALLGSLTQVEHGYFADPTSGDGTTRYLAGSGRTLLSAEGRTARTWDVVTGHRTSSRRLPGEVVAADPHARVLAVARDDGIRLWDTATGRWTGDPRPLPLDSLIDFAAGGYLVSGIDDDRVRLRSVKDGRVLFQSSSAGLLAPVVSADGRLVALCPANRAPQIWDVARHRTLPGPWEQAQGLCDGDEQKTLVLGTDGTRFAVLSESGGTVWDTASAREVAKLYKPGAERASFSEDGTFLATADGTDVRVWRMSDPTTPVFRHPLNNQHLYDLAWDPAGPNTLRYLEGGVVHCLDLGPAVTPGWREHPLAAVSMSPDAHTYATAERIGDRYRFELRAPSDGRLLRALPSLPLPVSTDPAEPVIPEDTRALLAFSPDGKALSYGVSADGRNTTPQRFTVWDLTHGRLRATLDLATPKATTPKSTTPKSTAAVVGLALGPRGDTLYAARRPVLGKTDDEAWDTRTGRRSRVLTGLSDTEFAVRPEGGLLAGDNRTAWLPSGKVVEDGLVQGEEISALAFAPDGSRLVAGDRTGRVALWDGEPRHRTGVLRNVFPTSTDEEPEAVAALAVSPDGATLAVGGGAGTLQLWDIATQQPLGGPLTTPGEEIDTLAFSADSGTLYAGSAHAPLQRYAVDPGRAVTRVCARAESRANFSREQWSTYVPEVAYRRLCG